MLRSYFICAGLFMGGTGIAAADPLSVIERKAVSAQAKSQTSSALKAVSLEYSRPDFRFQAETDRRKEFTFGDTKSVNLQTNLAEGFSRADSGLLIEPKFSRITSSDAGFESYSAEIRLGNVTFEKNNKKPTGWYVFAAADGEAVSMRADTIAGTSQNRTLTLSDQITVGDLQAGISTYVAGGTQLTFSYIETEASFSSQGGLDTSKRESFAGFSLAKEF